MSEVAQPLATDWIIAISAFGSLIILAFYTFYTYRMQKAVEKQVEELVQQRRLGIMPAILVEINDQDLIIRNVGNGTALSIILKPNSKEENIQKESEFIKKYAFEINILRPNEHYEKRVPAIMERKLDEIENKIEIFGKISFVDIKGNEYIELLKNIGGTALRHLKYGSPTIIEGD